MVIAFLSQPWSWYASGIGIALVWFLLHYFSKTFGVSSTLRTLCSLSGVGKRCSFFDFDTKSQRWNLAFVFGAILGGYIANTFLKDPNLLQLNPKTIFDLGKLGVLFQGNFAPESLFSWEGLKTIKGFTVLVIGGFLVGFGARWAGGCTSGHAISGLSNLQLPSLIAVIGFFIGGLFATFVLLPWVFSL